MDCALYFSFLMIRRPPRSTLTDTCFPDPTLVRPASPPKPAPTTTTRGACRALAVCSCPGCSCGDARVLAGNATDLPAIAGVNGAATRRFRAGTAAAVAALNSVRQRQRRPAWEIGRASCRERVCQYV